MDIIKLLFFSQPFIVIKKINFKESSVYHNYFNSNIGTHIRILAYYNSHHISYFTENIIFFFFPPLRIVNLQNTN